MNKFLEECQYIQEFDDYLDLIGEPVSEISYGRLNQHLLKYEEALAIRICRCKDMLEEASEKTDIYFTLAYLYSLEDPDKSIESLYGRNTRAYAIKTIRSDCRHHQAWALLADRYYFIALLGGDDKIGIAGIKILDSDKEIKTKNTVEDERVINRIKYFYKRAIQCIDRALDVDPSNAQYQKALKLYLDHLGSFK